MPYSLNKFKLTEILSKLKKLFYLNMVDKLNNITFEKRKIVILNVKYHVKKTIKFIIINQTRT